MSGALAGIRVLELGQVLAGPFAGAIFADLGAEVVKLERIEGGDDARKMGPAFRHGDALNFHIFNRGKKSVAIDLNSQAGKDAFERLAAASDIFIHNMSAASGRGEQAWVNNLNLDVLGLVRAQEVIAPAMEAGGGGAIVCLSSIAAQEEFAGPGSFGPMKAAMTAYANNLSQSLAPKGIRVNIVSPGPVFFEGGNWDTIKTHMTAFYEATVAKMPLKRLGDPREIANAIAFLASPAASLITGANLVIDGGYTKRIKF